MKIIGKGMIAEAFRCCGITDDDLLVFCSGVSNSQESSAMEFERERMALSNAQQMYPNKKLVYFSSCAVGMVDSPYYRHKMIMEDLVVASTTRYLICRLPQVVGVTRNTTLVNYIARCLRNGTPITVFKNAKRNLIDIEDAIRITIVLSGKENMIINISNGKMISISEIISHLSAALSIEPVIVSGPDENETGVYDGSYLMSLIGPDDRIYSEQYPQDVLKKYASKLGN